MNVERVKLAVKVTESMKIKKRQIAYTKYRYALVVQEFKKKVLFDTHKLEYQKVMDELLIRKKFRKIRAYAKRIYAWVIEEFKEIQYTKYLRALLITEFKEKAIPYVKALESYEVHTLKYKKVMEQMLNLYKKKNSNSQVEIVAPIVVDNRIFDKATVVPSSKSNNSIPLKIKIKVKKP